MNIFAVDRDPVTAATLLPDRHIVKMSLETCQLLSIVYSDWYHGWGDLHKQDGTSYSTFKGAFRNHPCTKWVAESYDNLFWLISHGIGLCEEYTYRYGKRHACQDTIEEALDIFKVKVSIGWILRLMEKKHNVSSFVRAMPDEFKLNEDIDDVTAYRLYVASKPWVKDNYLRKPDRKPDWIS
jgi:hypothetical protein